MYEKFLEEHKVVIQALSEKYEVTPRKIWMVLAAIPNKELASMSWEDLDSVTQEGLAAIKGLEGEEEIRGMPKYQGKEFTTTVQAPTRKELSKLLEGLHVYAREHGLEDIKVLERGRDPDGGFRAIVVAHNWNPIKWVREKWRGFGRPKLEPGVPAGLLPEPEVSRAYEESRRLREELSKTQTRAGKAEEEARLRKAISDRDERKRAQEEYEGRVPPRAKTAEEILAKLPEKERKRYERRIREGEKARVEAELEIWEAGIPGKKKVIHRVWNPTQQTWEFKEVEVPLTPQERLAEARVQKLGGYLVEEELAELKQRRRERRLPVRAARGATRFGKEVVAVGMLGIAGTAQAMQPGRGGPQRAARMLAPKAPSGLYGFGTPPQVDLSGLRRPLRPTIGLGGLGRLRGMVLPRRRV